MPIIAIGSLRSALNSDSKTLILLYDSLIKRSYSFTFLLMSVFVCSCVRVL